LPGLIIKCPVFPDAGYFALYQDPLLASLSREIPDDAEKNKIPDTGKFCCAVIELIRIGTREEERVLFCPVW